MAHEQLIKAYITSDREFNDVHVLYRIAQSKRAGLRQALKRVGVNPDKIDTNPTAMEEYEEAALDGFLE